MAEVKPDTTTDMETAAKLPFMTGKWVKDNEAIELQKLLGRTIPAPAERPAILDNLHALGHLGITGMVETLFLEQKLWWPGLRHDVEELVNNCADCQRYNRRVQGWLPPDAVSDQRRTMGLASDRPLGGPTGIGGRVQTRSRVRGPVFGLYAAPAPEIEGGD